MSLPPRMNSSTVQVTANGLRFRCRIDGTEGAPWMVFSNALATNLSVWDAQVAAFGGSFRILRYDQRGHGGTDVPPDACTFDCLTDDLLALLDAFRITRAVGAGVSMGAVTVLALAARHPDRLSAVVACDGQWAAPAGAADLWGQRITTAASEGMTTLVEPTVARWFTSPFVAARRPELDAVRRMIRDTPPDGFIRCAQALQAYDLRDEIARLPVPALFLVGEADGVLPPVMRHMHEAVAGSSFVQIPDAGHLPNVEQPDAVNRAIARFLAVSGHGAATE